MSDKAREFIVELFKIVDTKSILVIQSNGRLKRLYCPFKVICRAKVSPLIVGELYDVTAVKMTLKLEEVFIIDDKAYFVWYFSIKA